MPTLNPRQLLLDTAPEAAFDRITKLASRILGVPVALISILDTDRQFFKSQCGLTEPYASTRETPLKHSFCQHVGILGKPLIVNDARVHPLVRDNLAISTLGIIAYLGVPLFDHDGVTYGALCAIHREPRQWEEKDVEVLKVLANLIMNEVVLREVLEDQMRDLDELRRVEQDRTRAVQADRHDLRTPLNALLMSLQAMKQAGGLNDEHHEYLEMAERNGQALTAMVDKMLDIGLVEARGERALAKGLASAGDMVAAAVDQVAPLADGKRQALQSSVETEQAIPADADKIVRVLVNLLGNAVKYTPEGGRITLTARDHRSDGQPAVLFAIQDTGIGIGESDMQRIFVEGFRVDQRAPTRRSTGLGLTFCKRIVEAHSGRIWAESELGAGATFSFVLPSAGAGQALS